MKKVLIITAIFTIIDQVIKCILQLIFSYTTYGDIINIIPNFFSLTYLENTGAAFSILSSNTLFLIIVSIIALFFIYVCFIKDKKLNNFDNIVYSMLLGGIFGNLIDRIFRGFVIDYLDFSVFNFPVFNFADALIIISIILIVIKMIKGEKNEI